jgi:hypothetical protein
MARPEEINDPTYRVAMEEARDSLNQGRYLDVVQKCADSYLSLLFSRPEILVGLPGMRPAFAWPRLGVRLEMKEGVGPEMVWEREKVVLSEAITYYEFTLEQLIRATTPVSEGRRS